MILLRCSKYLKALKTYIHSRFFELITAPTRGHSLKLVKPRCRLDVRKFSFEHRLVEKRNSLDDRTIAFDSMNSFKIDLCMIY